MKFVTLATHSEGYFEYLQQSCKRHSIDLDIIGWGMEFQGWVWRLNLIKEYYQSLNPDDIVCFIDAYDVIILRNAAEIEKTFINMNARIVIAEDFNINPMKEIAARFIHFGTCNNVRVNAGTYIGYVRDVLWMVNAICAINDCESNTKLDDQKMITNLCKQIPIRFTIDTDKDIFLCTSYKSGMAMADISIDKQKVLYYKNTSMPCILHGAGKANIDDIIHALGYKIQQPTYSHEYNKEPFHQVMLGIICLIIIMIIGICTYYIVQKYNKAIKL